MLRPHSFSHRSQRRDQPLPEPKDPKKRPPRFLLPLLCTAGAVLAAGVILYSSCTRCYTVDVDGQSVAVFQGAHTYEEALSQAEERASQILNTEYSLDQILTIRPTFAPKSHIADTPELTESIMDLIPELEHVYTLSVDGTIVGAAKESDTVTKALNLVKERYTTPDTVSLEVKSQVDVRHQYLPISAGACTAESLAAELLVEAPRTFSYTIQEEDTLDSLTAYFSMTPERLQELNPDQDKSLSVKKSVLFAKISLILSLASK